MAAGNYPYDPYANGEQAVSPWSSLSSYANPLTWPGAYLKLKYMYNPATYSTGLLRRVTGGLFGEHAGVHVPFGRNIVEKGFPGTGNLFKNPKESIGGGFWVTSHGFDRSTNMYPAYKHAARTTSEMRDYITSNFKDIKKADATRIVKSIKGSAYSRTSQLGLLDWKDKSKFGRNIKLRKEYMSLAADAHSKLNSKVASRVSKESVEKIVLSQQSGVRSLVGVGVAAQSASVKKVSSPLMKWSMRGIGVAGKALSSVMLLSTMYDLGTMIGEPLGRAIVGAADRGMLRLQEQFRPEMGGALSPEFLTREAATERQRALESMSKSFINGRTAFGQEASLMHN